MTDGSVGSVQTFSIMGGSSEGGLPQEGGPQDPEEPKRRPKPNKPRQKKERTAKATANMKIKECQSKMTEIKAWHHKIQSSDKLCLNCISCFLTYV